MFCLTPTSAQNAVPRFARYVNGSHYLKEKYGFDGIELSVFLDRWFNCGVCFVFPVALFIINMILYVIPLPAFVKAKFRE